MLGVPSGMEGNGLALGTHLFPLRPKPLPLSWGTVLSEDEHIACGFSIFFRDQRQGDVLSPGGLLPVGLF